MSDVVVHASALTSPVFPMVTLGAIVTERTEKVAPGDLPALSVGQQGVTPQLDGVAKQTTDGFRKVVRAGDVAINTRADRRGASGLATTNGSVSLVYSVLKLNPSVLNSRFCHHLMRSVAFQEEFFRWGTGIVDDLWSTNFTRMSRIPIPVPPLPTQQRIADYLDRETGEIDAMLAKMDELTASLETRRSVAIESAIFAEGHRGALGYIVSCLPGFAFPSSQFSTDSSNVPLLRGVNVKPHGLDWSETVYWNLENAATLSEYFVKPGDIVLGMDRPFVNGGTRAVQVAVEAPRALLVQRVLRLRVPPRLGDARYVLHALGSQAFKEYATTGFTGISVPHISEDQVRNFRLPLPSPTEQTRIADHLDEVTGRIDAMLDKVATLKSLLTERRAALITDVVTGRKEVA